jgi:hypothetical protein
VLQTWTWCQSGPCSTELERSFAFGLATFAGSASEATRMKQTKRTGAVHGDDRVPLTISMQPTR